MGPAPKSPMLDCVSMPLGSNPRLETSTSMLCWLVHLHPTLTDLGSSPMTLLGPPLASPCTPRGPPPISPRTLLGPAPKSPMPLPISSMTPLGPPLASPCTPWGPPPISPRTTLGPGPKSPMPLPRSVMPPSTISLMTLLEHPPASPATPQKRPRPRSAVESSSPPSTRRRSPGTERPRPRSSPPSTQRRSPGTESATTLEFGVSSEDDDVPPAPQSRQQPVPQPPPFQAFDPSRLHYIDGVWQCVPAARPHQQPPVSGPPAAKAQHKGPPAGWVYSPPTDPGPLVRPLPLWIHRAG